MCLFYSMFPLKSQIGVELVPRQFPLLRSIHLQHVIVIVYQQIRSFLDILTRTFIMRQSGWMS